MSTTLAEEIALLLKTALGASEIQIEDESWKHAGHKQGAAKSHFKVAVVSPAFEQKPLLERHRLVNDAVFGKFSSQVHSLAIKAFTPEEWAKLK